MESIYKSDLPAEIVIGLLICSPLLSAWDRGINLFYFSDYKLCGNELILCFVRGARIVFLL